MAVAAMGETPMFPVIPPVLLYIVHGAADLEGTIGTATA
jgi:hypothetical protein